MTHFFFNGHDMTEHLDVVSFGVSALPKATPITMEVGGRDGVVYLGSRLEPYVVTVEARLATDSIDPAEIQRRWALVASLLRTREPAPLSISPGIYRMAVLHEETPLEFFSYSATASLQFYCPDPVAFGDERTVSVPSGGSATFTVGGTHPTFPTIAASAAVRNATSHGWRVRLDDGDFVQVDTGTSNAAAVSIDCAKRTCRVGSTYVLPTLTSDWLELAPGEHTIRNDLGTGACTVTFRERWL